MRAILVGRYGPAEALELAEVPAPAAAAGEVVIRQSRVGVNFADVYMRRGLYHGQHTYGTGLPFVLGLEGVGEVVEAGDGVETLRPGDRVGYCLGKAAYAEQVAVAAAKCVKLPSWCDDDTAAALMLQGATSHYLTHSAYPLAAGEWCLIHAGAGGVGRLLIQIAKAKGAKVITTVGSPAKAAAVAELGADVVVLYREEDPVERVREATGGAGVDVVYDSVGRDTIAASLRCLRVRGTCILFGASSGPVESVVPMDLAEAGSVFFTRPHLAHYRRAAAEAQRRADDIFRLVEQGSVKPNIDSVFPLAEAVAAHRRLESRQSAGKILLQP